MDLCADFFFFALWVFYFLSFFPVFPTEPPSPSFSSCPSATPGIRSGAGVHLPARRQMGEVGMSGRMGGAGECR